VLDSALPAAQPVRQTNQDNRCVSPVAYCLRSSVMPLVPIALLLLPPLCFPLLLFTFYLVLGFAACFFLFYVPPKPSPLRTGAGVRAGA